MANSYYTPTNVARVSKAKSATQNTERALVEAGFDKLPTPTQVQTDALTYAADTGSANTYAIALPKTLSAYVTGMCVRMKVTNTNTGASTINVDTVGAKNIKRVDGTDPSAGDLTAGDIVELIYDGTNFVQQGPYRSLLSGTHDLSSNLAFSGNPTFTGNPSFSNIDVNGGAVDGTPIGAASANTGAFTTLTASGDLTIGDAFFVDETTKEIGIGKTAALAATIQTEVDQEAQILLSRRSDGTDSDISIYMDSSGSGNSNRSVQLKAVAETGVGDNNSSLAILTPAGVAQAERMRVNYSGTVFVGKTATGIANDGVEIYGTGRIDITDASNALLFINRKTDDGNLVNFYQDGTLEGNISVSGTVVTYGNFTGSHYSECEKPTEFLPGTIVESTGELVSDRFTASERLVKFQVAGKGSKAVYGTILGPSLEDDIEDEDGNKIPQGEGRNPVRTQYLVTGLGAYQVRMKKGQKPVNGDLVESAGGGVGAVQKDDIVTSRTVAKITGAHSVATYDDGSTVWPAVIMCG